MDNEERNTAVDFVMADGTLCITDKKNLIQKPLYYMLITAQVYLKSFSLCVFLFRRDSSFLDAVYNSPLYFLPSVLVLPSSFLTWLVFVQ